MAVAIASGDIDYAVTAVSGGLISLAQKGAIKVIGGALSEEAGIDGQKILVSDAAFQAGIKTPKDLAGKSWGVTQAGSSFHYMGAKVAASEGIELKFKPLQKVGAIIGALKSGQIDGWSIVPHIAKPLAGSGAVHIIGDVADYVPNYQVATVFTSAQNASDERAVLRPARPRVPGVWVSILVRRRLPSGDAVCHGRPGRAVTLLRRPASDHSGDVLVDCGRLERVE